MASQSSQSSQNRSYYPVDIQPLINQTTGNLGSSYGNINNFLNNPLDSSMFKNTIGSMLETLLPSEDASRTALADQFRMAGGGQGGALQSGAFAKGAQMNERNILDQRGRFVATNASDTFRNILSGLGLQLNAAEAPSRLLGNIRPVSEGSSQGSSSSQDPMQFLGFGGGSGGGGGGRSSITGPGDYGNYAPTSPFTNNTGNGGGGYMTGANTALPAGVDFTGFTGASYRPQFTQQPLQYNYGDGQRTTQDRNTQFNDQGFPADQYGYTQSDWAADPYYQ